MVKELAKLATKESKDVDELREHMLCTAALLTPTSDPHRFSEDIEKLQQAKFLSCIAPNGRKNFVATSETFLIADNDSHREYFQGKLTLLNFTYEDFNTLHPLFRLLGLEGNRYLSKSVVIRTEEGESTMQATLTERFRECAFALSWYVIQVKELVFVLIFRPSCAVLHKSPLYAKKARHMHNSLRETAVRISSTMRTLLVVDQNGNEVKVDSNKVPLVLDRQGQSLRIVLPADELQRRSCFRNRLPTMLCELLKIQDVIAQKQVYRILNEVDLGTDEIMAQEDIPAASWLEKTARSAPLLSSAESIPELASGSKADSMQAEARKISPSTEQTQAGANLKTLLSPPSRSDSSHGKTCIPTTLLSQQEAIRYHEVLEHVRMQARKFIGCSIGGKILDSFAGLARDFGKLAISGKKLGSTPLSELFGNDDPNNIRIGAAGELFESLMRYKRH